MADTFDAKKWEVIVELVQYLNGHNTGSAAIWTDFYILKRLITTNVWPGYKEKWTKLWGKETAENYYLNRANSLKLSKSMTLVKDLQEDNPVLLEKLLPYIDPESNIFKPKTKAKVTKAGSSKPAKQEGGW